MEQTIIFLVILILSIIFHEVAHGMMALRLGDHTAENAGRLTLNPIPHIDLMGSIILPAFLVIAGSPFLFGWAKPVPFNPHNLRDKKWGEAKVALAGPTMNIILALLFIAAIYALEFFNLLNQNIFNILQMASFMNFFLAFLNLIPVVPLDGSKILFSFLSHPKYLKLKKIMIQNQFLIIILVLFLLMNTSFISYFTFWVFNLFF